MKDKSKKSTYSTTFGVDPAFSVSNTGAWYQMTPKNDNFVANYEEC